MVASLSSLETSDEAPVPIRAHTPDIPVEDVAGEHPVKKRRGRPPGSKNKIPKKSVIVPTTPTTSSFGDLKKKSRAGLPVEAGYPAKKPRGRRPTALKDKISTTSIDATTTAEALLFNDLMKKSRTDLHFKAALSAIRSPEKRKKPVLRAVSHDDAGSTPKRRGRPPGSKKEPRYNLSRFLDDDGDPPAVGSTIRGIGLGGKTAPQRRREKRKAMAIWDPIENGNVGDGEEDGNELGIDEGQNSVFVVADKIFREQVDFLVNKAGASKNFRAVVHQLWFSYLTVALPDVSRGVEAAIEEDKAWLNSLRPQDFCALMVCTSRDLNGILKLWRGDIIRRREECLEDDILDESAISGSGRKRKEEFDDLDADATMVRAEHIFHVPERLTITRIVAIILLGLRICDERILGSDLLRWIRAMQFPFLEFYSGDSGVLNDVETIAARHLFGNLVTTTVSFCHLEFLAGATVKILNIDPAGLPTQSVIPLVERFIEELNLPQELLLFVTKFLAEVNSLDYAVDSNCTGQSFFRRRGANIEARVMAGIVYSLRMLFGLDGLVERTICEETDSLNELLEDGFKLFSFKEWCNFIQHRRLAFFRHLHIFRSSSAPASLRFISEHLGPPESNKSLAAKRNSMALNRVYRNLQLGFQRSDFPKLEPPKEDVTLPPTLRPYRAYGIALGDLYPGLLVEFESTSISHVMDVDKPFGKPTLPRQWTLKDDATHGKALGHFGRIRGVRFGALYHYPLRGHNIRGCATEPSLNLVPSESLQFLIEVAAEMIEQTPEALLGEVLYLELALYPVNPECTRLSGRAYQKIVKLRQGE